jgi:hypothetical protein
METYINVFHKADDDMRFFMFPTRACSITGKNAFRSSSNPQPALTQTVPPLLGTRGTYTLILC